MIRIKRKDNLTKLSDLNLGQFFIEKNRPQMIFRLEYKPKLGNPHYVAAFISDDDFGLFEFNNVEVETVCITKYDISVRVEVK